MSDEETRVDVISSETLCDSTSYLKHFESNEETAKQMEKFFYTAMINHPEHGLIGIAFDMKMLDKLYDKPNSSNPKLTLCVANSKSLFALNFEEGKRFFNENMLKYPFPPRDLSLKSGKNDKKADDLYHQAYAEGIKPAETRRLLRECIRYRALAVIAKKEESGKN